MRRNGFTLVEVVTVIVIMITISLIAVFSITGIVKSSTEKLYELQITSILDASRTYAVKNSNMLSDNNEITICDLKRSSLLDEDLKNPRTEEQFDNSLVIKITKNSLGEFEFEFDAETKMVGYKCDLDITVVMNGDSPLYTRLGDNYVDQGITVSKRDIVCTRGNGSNSDTQCYYNLETGGNYASALTDNKYSKSGTYKQTYSVTVGDFSSTITRTIVVQDKTPPTIHVSYGGSTYTNPFSVRIVEDTIASFSCSATDNNDENVQCVIQKNTYNGTTSPGTYEIIYSAKDKYGNSSTLLVNITVLSKNKKLIVGANVSSVNWTNDSVTLKIIPLYSQSCSHYNYTFDGFFWNDTDTLTVTENGNYRMGIKCLGTNDEDVMFYQVSNIDRTAPTFENGAHVTLNTSGNYSEITKNGYKYYYSNGPVSVTHPSGATDSGSGVAGYEVYVNGSLFTGNSLDDNGVYEIKILAYDAARNRSELVTASYVVISTLKPTCDFIRCSATRECNTTQPISGDNVTYNLGSYRLTTADFTNPITILYKLSCTYQYYDGEEGIYESTSLPRNKFYMEDANGALNQIDVVSVTNNLSDSVTSCDAGLCTKTNNYIATINLYGTSKRTNLYLNNDSLCDRVGNCNTSKVMSMDLRPFN